RACAASRLMWLRFNGSAISPSIQIASRAMLRTMASDATSFFDDAHRRAARWLAAWDAQGIHRTATIGGRAGAVWLAQQAAAPGAAVTIEEFALDRLDPVAAFLEFGGEQIEGVPVFDVPATDGTGVTG